jgi:DNA processing protein
MDGQDGIDRWLAMPGARRLVPADADYPSQLAAVGGRPPDLYVLGDVALLSRPQVAIVGSRNPTAAGRRVAAEMARGLVAAGFVITSGLARGIDAAAHAGALNAGGATVAVLGTGPDICYPRDNRPLFERIARGGALVSEFPPGTGPRAHHFPRRNRIISGLARAVVVIEAAADSGSLITASHAADQGRDVFAVPGSPLNPLAAGCNALIRSGAVLARDAADVLAETGRPQAENSHQDQRLVSTQESADGKSRLDKDYEMLLDALGFEPASIDDLVDRTGLSPRTVASMMLILELQGRVEARPGALYNRVI